MSIVSENIKEIRKTLGMTQKQLAKETGLSIGTIQGYEQGRYEPKIEALTALITALGCTYDDIIDRPLLDIDDSYAYCYWLFDENIPAEQYEKLLEAFNQLGEPGQNKAVEQVELLTKIPEYRKDSEQPDLESYDFSLYAMRFSEYLAAQF